MYPDAAISQLLQSRDPSIAYFTLTELLGKPASERQVLQARRAISRGEKVRRLLSGQQRDGGFGVHAYTKWTGGFWRLVALAELAMPPGDRRVRKLADHVLAWVEGRSRTGTSVPLKIGHLVRVHATQEGYALAACSLLGMAGEPRVKRLAEQLIEWQWPDGGWNCDRSEDASHSSFHETHGALWGLAEYHQMTGNSAALKAARLAAGFLLRHRLFRSERTGKVIDEAWLRVRFPPYWHYDVLQGLWVLSRSSSLEDRRAADALDLLARKRRPDGMWRADGYHWKPPGSIGSNVEVVDWGRGGPSEWVTLRALRVLKPA